MNKGFVNKKEKLNLFCFFIITTLNLIVANYEFGLVQGQVLVSDSITNIGKNNNQNGNNFFTQNNETFDITHFRDGDGKPILIGQVITKSLSHSPLFSGRPKQVMDPEMKDNSTSSVEQGQQMQPIDKENNQSAGP